jgi:hypothetical protein
MLILPWPRTARSQLVLLLGENLAQEVELLTLLLERCGVTLPDEREEEGEEGRELLSPSTSSSSPSSPPSSPALNMTCHEKKNWIHSTPFGRLIEEKEKGRLEKAKMKNKRQAILIETLGMRRGSTLTHIPFLEQEEKDLTASGEANSGGEGESFQSEYDIYQSQSLRGEEPGREEGEGDTDAEIEEDDGIPIPRLRRR